MKAILRLLPALAVVSLGHLHAQDTIPPEVTSISISPGSVDVGTMDQTVMVTLNVTDNESGFAFGNVFLYTPTDGFVSNFFFNIDEFIIGSGDNLDGDYKVIVTVPQYATPGTWSMGVAVWDNEDRRRDYGPGDDPFPTPGDEDFTVVNAGTVDSAAPQVPSASVSPGSIDTGSMSQDVTVTVNITDDLSGFRSATVAARDPSNNVQFGFSKFLGAASASSGNALNGNYDVTLTVPFGSADGTWTITLFTRDEVGNIATISPPGASFVVSNTGGGLQGDLSDACDATQYTWTTTGDADWFIQNATTSDGIDAAQSGPIGPFGSSEMSVDVTGPGDLDFSWKVSSEEDFDILMVELDGGYEDEISGEVDWTTGSIIIPPGPHTVTWRYEKDDATDEGDDAGWVDQVKFVGDSDTELPVLQRISISPSPVDISGGDVDVTITLEVTDDFNGVSGGYVEFYDPNGENYDGTSYGSFERISGDARCGVYEIQITINQSDLLPPDFFELGTWQAAVCVTEAVTFNDVTYGVPFGGDPFPIPGTEFFTVGDGVGGADTSAPVITAINSITPNPVNISIGAQSVVVDLDIGDNDSGFAYANVFLYSPSGYIAAYSFDTDDLLFGNPNSGTYEVTIPIPEYGPPGTWNLAFGLNDNAGNERDYPFDTSFPNPGDEQFTVTNTGTADTQTPVLTSFTLTPDAVDTSASMQSIDVSFTMTENLSGLGSVFLYVYDPTGTSVGPLFTFFNGAGALSDTFMTTLDIPQGSMEGTWEVSVFARDKVGNNVRYGKFGIPFPTPGEEEFTVGPLSPSTYGNFVTTFSLTGPDALPSANPDKDLFNNALELLLGLDPTMPDLANPAIFGITDTGSELQLNFTIDPTLTVAVSGDQLEVSDATGSPFMLTGQTGSNLVDDWANQLPANTGGSSYRVSTPITPGTNGNIRLEFTVP